MRRIVTAMTAAMLAGGAAIAQTASVTNDPYIWLEDKDGAKALQWVGAENAKTLPRLENDPRYAAFHAEALAIAEAKDRIPMPAQRFGRIYNFWRDADHPQGILRWTSESDYANASPRWTTALDVDALGKADGKKWVYKGSSCLQPEERLCLVALSEGGEDAVTYREFDLASGQFVAGGFTLPRAKQNVAWVDQDTLLVARDWGQGTLTQSGYPFVVKLVKRGAPLDEAREVYRGEASDQGGSSPQVLSDAKGNRLVLIQRRKTFFGADKLLWTPQGTKKLAMPDRAFAQDMVNGKVIFQTSDPWGALEEGSVAWAPLAEVAAGTVTPRELFVPNARQSVQGVTATRDRVVVTYTDNVRGRASVFAANGDGWSAQPIAVPDNVSVDLVSATDRNDLTYLSVTGFLTPTQLVSLDVAKATKPATVKTLPARFDAAGLKVDQFEATSSDGTKVPYFIVHRADAPRNGSTPTIMTAYGGFEVSMNPSYVAVMGKLWLERGGAYVLANIRGGGEFGPKWHDAGRKTKRQLIYDDFASVARDLFTRKLTSADELGIYGGSNGGLLMGVEFTQHPELWKAVTIQVPLLDMQRYEQIAAGYSWVDEYGSVKNPDEAAFLAKISPYNNLKKGGRYPEPYIWTTTKDDRVGPQHARKFAARMQEYGLPYLFYEDTAGGHSGDADIKQGARLQALQMTYFAQKLLGSAATATASK